tara:strand:- start:68 stop:217 length:150 start_codon:yes stop_codon:yes gene_type:complete
MNQKELIDRISSNLFKESGKKESLKSWQTMRNYLNQLDIEELRRLSENF